MVFAHLDSFIYDLSRAGRLTRSGSARTGQRLEFVPYATGKRGNHSQEAIGRGRFGRRRRDVEITPNS